MKGVPSSNPNRLCHLLLNRPAKVCLRLRWLPAHGAVAVATCVLGRAAEGTDVLGSRNLHGSSLGRDMLSRPIGPRGCFVSIEKLRLADLDQIAVGEQFPFRDLRAVEMRAE